MPVTCFSQIGLILNTHMLFLHGPNFRRQKSPLSLVLVTTSKNKAMRKIENMTDKPTGLEDGIGGKCISTLGLRNFFLFWLAFDSLLDNISKLTYLDVFLSLKNFFNIEKFKKKVNFNKPVYMFLRGFTWVFQSIKLTK